MVLLQESFIGTQEINHSAFNFYWPQTERKKIRVLMIIQKTLTNKMGIEHKTDFINYFHVMLLEICKLDPSLKKSGRKTRAVNIYNN